MLKIPLYRVFNLFWWICFWNNFFKLAPKILSNSSFERYRCAILLSKKISEIRFISRKLCPKRWGQVGGRKIEFFKFYYFWNNFSNFAPKIMSNSSFCSDRPPGSNKKKISKIDNVLRILCPKIDRQVGAENPIFIHFFNFLIKIGILRSDLPVYFWA